MRTLLFRFFTLATRISIWLRSLKASGDKMKSKYLKNYMLIITAIFLLSGCIGVNQEFKNIRSTILESINDDFDRQIEFSIGPVGFFIASQFVKFADTEENVDKMLKQIHNMHIGVYDRLSNFSKPKFSLLKEITEDIVDSDWKSLVKSVNDSEMVGVYFKEIGNSETLENIREVFIVTLSSDELVLLKIEGDLGSVIETIIKQHGHEFQINDKS